MLIFDLVVMVMNGSLARSSPLNPEIWWLCRLVIGSLSFDDQGNWHLLHFLKALKGYGLFWRAISNLVIVLGGQTNSRDRPPEKCKQCKVPSFG